MILKKKLFGYEKDSVEKIIAESNNQLQQANAEIAVLKEKLEQTKAEAVDAKNKLEAAALQNQKQILDMEWRLKNMSEEYKAAQKKLAELGKRNDSIGHLYFYAYENAAKMAKLAHKGSKEYIEKTAASITDIQSGADVLIDELKENEQQIHAMLNNMIQSMKKLDTKMSSFTEKSQQIKKSLNTFENYKKPLSNELEKVIEDFESNTRHFFIDKTTDQTTETLITANPKEEVEVGKADDVLVTQTIHSETTPEEKETLAPVFAAESPTLPAPTPVVEVTVAPPTLPVAPAPEIKEEPAAAMLKPDENINKNMKIKSLLKKYSKLG